MSKRSSKDDSWPAATNAGPDINTSSDECMPCISADGLKLYFGSARPGGYGADDLYVVTWATTDETWSDPENVGPAVNSQGGDASPSISPDGLTLFFNSNRNGGFGSADLYVITRPNIEAPWSTAINLGETINITDGQWHRIGFVRDGFNRKLYVDDIEVANDTMDSLESATGGLHIGTGRALEPGTYFSGLIDDIRIYDRVVSR